jgi:hypothetical protein
MAKAIGASSLLAIAAVVGKIHVIESIALNNLVQSLMLIALKRQEIAA